MSIIAVMVNCALIGMSDLADRLFIGWGTVERLVFIIILEVTAYILCLKSIIPIFKNKIWLCFGQYLLVP